MIIGTIKVASISIFIVATAETITNYRQNPEIVLIVCLSTYSPRPNFCITGHKINAPKIPLIIVGNVDTDGIAIAISLISLPPPQMQNIMREV